MIYTYIHMYSKRANIMFDQNGWNYLTSLAKKKKTTVGVLVRDAVQQAYGADIRESNKIRAIKSILATRPKPQKWDYKALIEEGRTR